MAYHMLGVTLHAATRDHLVATWQSVLILVWRDQTTLVGIKSAERFYDSLAATNPGGVFLLNIVEPGAPVPKAEVRAAMAAFLAKRANRMILSAVVHEGSGFHAAAVRSVVTGLALLTKLPYRHKVFATVEAAASWFAANSPVARGWGAVALSTAVAEVRMRASKAAHA